MSSAPLVSILVPAYNRAGLIAETLDALLAQTGPMRTEILVIDDGSTDATPDILRRYADRIRVLRQPNQGAAAARNLALRHARGDYIAFCDSDDLWPPGKLERQVPLLQAHPRAGFVYGDFRCFEIGPDGARREWALERPTPSGFILPDLLQRNFIVPSTALVTREAAEIAGPFDPACCNAEDYDYFLRIALRREVLYDDRISCLYRQHTVTASRQKERYWRGFLRSLQKIREAIQALHRQGELRHPLNDTTISPGEVRRWDALLRRRIASFHVRLARYCCRKGSPDEAWKQAADAFRLTPTNPQTWTTIWKAFRQRLGPRENS